MIKERVLGFFVKYVVKPVRFWSDSEWNQLSDVEKVWIWYKHHWHMKICGYTESSIIMEPLKELILYGGIIIVALNTLTEKVGIGMTAEALIVTAAATSAGLWVFNFTIQWIIGTWKDKRDLNTLEREVGNRRDAVLRSIRKGDYVSNKKVIKR